MQPYVPIECVLVFFDLFSCELMEFGVDVAMSKLALDRIAVIQCIVNLLSSIQYRTEFSICRHVCCAFTQTLTHALERDWP